MGNDYSPTATAAPSAPCTDCPSYNGVKSAALLIFSDERINNQLRRSNETETPDPILANSKATISNYLEPPNNTNYPDATGNQDYNNGAATSNDRVFCIPEDMSATVECP